MHINACTLRAKERECFLAFLLNVLVTNKTTNIEKLLHFFALVLHDAWTQPLLRVAISLKLSLTSSKVIKLEMIFQPDLLCDF